MNHRRTIILAAALLALARDSASVAGSLEVDEIPAQVRYEQASPAATDAAADSLRSALAAGPEALAKLFGPHETPANATIAGPFFGIHIASLELDVSRYFGNFVYKSPAGSLGAPMEAHAFYADSPERRRLLAQLVYPLAQAADPGKIRAPTYDELVLVWYWIGWDLAGPLLVYETDHEKMLFDFDSTGHITWIERLTDPCMTGSQDDKQVMSCRCMKVRRKKKDWHIEFEPKPICPIIGLMTSIDQLMASADPKDEFPEVPSIAYIRIGTRARVDEMLIDAYRPDHALFRLPAEYPGYQSVGKLLSGTRPKPVFDTAGEKVHGYVLLASIINSAGHLVANRALLYTDPRLADSAIDSANGTVVEAAQMRGKPVPEAIWQQISF